MLSRTCQITVYRNEKAPAFAPGEHYRRSLAVNGIIAMSLKKSGRNVSALKLKTFLKNLNIYVHIDEDI